MWAERISIIPNQTYGVSLDKQLVIAKKNKPQINSKPPRKSINR